MNLRAVKRKKADYEKPEIVEIDLLDESAQGWSEPPPPEQPGGDGDDDSYEDGIEDALGM
ncbi:MAG: hypothetical protein P9L92_02370 [Candidatus Electryonea clarkiae]|nr:hypothetical protein [Candidatus Electryonea clarkiae]MDP8288417.1 hypothetical protein [Candidatus Electryonea clarkiae]